MNEATVLADERAEARSADVGRGALRKATWRLLPLIGLGYGIAYMDRINISFAALFASQDLAYWRDKLDAAGLIWEPVALLSEVIDDPALRERGAFSTIVHRTGGAMEIISAPFHIRDAGVEVRGPAPDVGQHTREVFAEAGISAARIDELLARGVIV